MPNRIDRIQPSGTQEGLPATPCQTVLTVLSTAVKSSAWQYSARRNTRTAVKSSGNTLPGHIDRIESSRKVFRQHQAWQYLARRNTRTSRKVFRQHQAWPYWHVNGRLCKSPNRKPTGWPILTSCYPYRITSRRKWKQQQQQQHPNNSNNTQTTTTTTALEQQQQQQQQQQKHDQQQQQQQNQRQTTWIIPNSVNEVSMSLHFLPHKLSVLL